jgi:hypothetical protein
MIYQIKIDESVLLDFDDNFIYYKNISIRVANKFRTEFKDKINYIQKYPFHHRLKYKEFRIANLKKFPFGIHFFIEVNTIHIIKLIHSKQFIKKIINP